jgi:prefoldin subunit 1
MAKPFQERLNERKATCSEKIKTLEANKEYLERNLKESENGLRELILSKQGATVSS